jgi:hypothetical protein
VKSSAALCDAEPMKIEITEDAQRLLAKKGGTMSIDFIRPTG